MREIILASSSPRRNELLQNLKIPFKVCVPEVDENLDKTLPSDIYVQELALLKGSAVLKQCRQRSNVVIIAADTVVSKDKLILGKPKDMDEARMMLSMLSGKIHEVVSGICVLDGHLAVCRYEKTEVVFKTLSDEQIESYIHTKEPFDKAGAYAMQGEASQFVERIEGDYYNVVGLPMRLLCRILKENFSLDTAKFGIENEIKL